MSLVLAATSPSEPQRERSLRPPTEGLVLGLIGARRATFTAKTRPKSTSPNERGAFGGFAKGVSQLSRAPYGYRSAPVLPPTPAVNFLDCLGHVALRHAALGPAHRVPLSLRAVRRRRREPAGCHATRVVGRDRRRALR